MWMRRTLALLCIAAAVVVMSLFGTREAESTGMYALEVKHYFYFWSPNSNAKIVDGIIDFYETDLAPADTAGTGVGTIRTISQGDTFWTATNMPSHSYDVYWDSAGTRTLVAESMPVWSRTVPDSSIKDTSAFYPGCIPYWAYKNESIREAAFDSACIPANAFQAATVGSSALANYAVRSQHCSGLDTSDAAFDKAQWREFVNVSTGNKETMSVEDSLELGDDTTADQPLIIWHKGWTIGLGDWPALRYAHASPGPAIFHRGYDFAVQSAADDSFTIYVDNGSGVGIMNHYPDEELDVVGTTQTDTLEATVITAKPSATSIKVLLPFMPDSAIFGWDICTSRTTPGKTDEKWKTYVPGADSGDVVIAQWRGPGLRHAVASANIISGYCYEADSVQFHLTRWNATPFAGTDSVFSYWVIRPPIACPWGEWPE